MIRSISTISPIILIVIVLAGGFFWWPYYENFNELLDKLDQKEKQAEKEKKLSLEIKETLKKLDNYKDEVEKIKTAVPDGVLVPELFNFIQNESRYNGLVLTDIGVSKAAISDFSPSMEKTSISVSLLGRYSSIKNFLSSLHRNIRLIGVESVSLSPRVEEDRPGSFNFNLVLKVHSHKPDSPPDDSLDSLDLKF